MLNYSIKKIFIYDSCPFCIKTLMLAKKSSIEVVRMSFDDENTPKMFVGNKQAPIAQDSCYNYIAESSDICAELMSNQPSLCRTVSLTEEITIFLKCLGSILVEYKHNIASYIVSHPLNRQTFPHKKSKMYYFNRRGIEVNYNLDIERLKNSFAELEKKFHEESMNNDTLTTVDLQVFPNLYLLNV